MSSFEIFTDSAANLPDAERQAYGIHVIPLKYVINGVEYPCYDENVPFRALAENYYKLLRQGTEIKTSLISESEFIEAVTPALEQGKDAVILTMASGISGTFQQAKAAARTLSERFPARTVIAADSANASMGQGLLAMKTAELRDMGESAESAAQWLKDNAYRLNSYLTVDDLKYLNRSGRISAMLAFAGNLLNIKPVISADGNEVPKLTVSGKERGRRKAVSAIIRAFEENVISPETQTVAITHADCEEDALALAEEIKRRGVKDVIIEYYDLCTASHVGPGTIALFFMGKDRREPKKEESHLFAKKRISDCN